MPRTLGDSFVHISKLHHVVEVDEPVLELTMAPEISDVARRIGENIASLIPDGATLQMGIGEIPDAVLLFLEDKRHLGVHTEMFSDGLVDLFEAGVVTNERKTLHRGKIVASFVIGSRKSFDFVDNNPFMEFHPNEYVNDPFIIAKNDNMVAINSALAGRPHRPGLRRLHRHPHLLRLRRPARLHPRRRPLQGRGADHRAPVHRQGRLHLAASSTPSCPAPASSPPGPTCTTSSPSTASPTSTDAACASVPGC